MTPENSSDGQQTRLIVVRAPIANPDPSLPLIQLEADRMRLAKRRWRGAAADGQEFGFDLEQPLRHGEVFFQTGAHRYQIVQRPELVLQARWDTPHMAARIAWQIGNLHFPIMIEPGRILAENDSAVRQMLEREGLAPEVTSAIFRPLTGAPAHGHSHQSSGHGAVSASDHPAAAAPESSISTRHDACHPHPHD